MTGSRLLALVLALGFADCSQGQGPNGLGPPSASRTAPQSGAKTLASVLIEGVPHVRQKPDFCGEAASESWLSALGLSVDQDRVFALSTMDPARGMGATTRELRVALERLGFDVGPVWQTIPAADDAALEQAFSELHADLQRRVPSIVCMHYDASPQSNEHFRLVLGYDAATDEVVYHEPARTSGAYQRLPRREFLALWPLKYQASSWSLIRLRLAGTPHAPSAEGAGPKAADYAQHVLALRPRVPPGFSVVVAKPFVVLGDDTEARVRANAEHVVSWAVERLERDFFPRTPERILDIWLFKDDESYRRNTRALFGKPPSTPFGYYSSEDGALVMNIGTGGGTLVHEIVHPFIEANFPNCPAWFNEGLGSLFEQSADRDGHIVGLTNWRLAGLQRAIRRKELPSFRALMAKTSQQFYDEDPGSNYAQARYLLYYLQERGVLGAYYREFTAQKAQDPTGFSSLLRVLDEHDASDFQARWQQFVLGLHFP